MHTEESVLYMHEHAQMIIYQETHTLQILTDGEL